MTAPAIDEARLKSLLDSINGFGRVDGLRGLNRRGFTEEDLAARRWLAARMEEEGLAVSWDGVGNLFGRWGESDRPAIMAGSHTDTVPEGGAFDGALGVAIALECVLALKEAGFEPKIPIEVVNTSEEEGRFGGMLGSQTISGKLKEAWFREASDADGVKLTDAMRAAGFDPEAALASARPKGSARAFLELHIEQGPVLEKAGLPVGIVDRVSGICNWQVTLTGVANHSGTTPMELRADAFAGMAEVGTRISEIIRDHGTERSRVTIGKVEIGPNHPHTVPGLARFSVVTRDTDEEAMKAMCGAIRRVVEEAAARHGLGWSIDEKSWLSPVALDPDLRTAMVEEAERLGIPHRVMPSGAGHDAQTMQGFCPSALVFVQSRGGISHAPEEWTEWEHIVTGARLMLAAVQRLAAGDPQ